MRLFRDIGPGVLIAAAFIGPGTVTLCTIAGASFGYSLIWAIIFSIFSTIEIPYDFKSILLSHFGNWGIFILFQVLCSEAATFLKTALTNPL